MPLVNDTGSRGCPDDLNPNHYHMWDFHKLDKKGLGNPSPLLDMVSCLSHGEKNSLLCPWLVHCIIQQKYNTTNSLTSSKLLLLLLLLLLPFYATLDCVQDYPWELAPERQNQEGKANLYLLEQEIVRLSGSGISLAYANLHLAPDSKHLTKIFQLWTRTASNQCL